MKKTFHQPGQMDTFEKQFGTGPYIFLAIRLKSRLLSPVIYFSGINLVSAVQAPM